LPSGLLSKTLNIEIQQIIILPFALFLKLAEELRFRVFENRALRALFGPKKDEIVRTFMILNKWTAS
jgi:hypothetical protein